MKLGLKMVGGETPGLVIPLVAGKPVYVGEESPDGARLRQLLGAAVFCQYYFAPRRHCEILWDGKEVRVTALKAFGDTYLNEARVVTDRPIPIWPCETVRVGNVELVLVARVPLDPSWLRWNDGTVPRLAQAIYEGRRFGDMPILHDALLDAGCDDQDILDHLRSPGPHVRGCWVIDLNLGKE
jgi:hypothetical protein